MAQSTGAIALDVKPFRGIAMLYVAMMPGKAQPPRMRIAIAGLALGRVDGSFRLRRAHREVEVVGVSEPDEALRKNNAAQDRLPAGQRRQNKQSGRRER
jgi:hypothetical protein